MLNDSSKNYPNPKQTLPSSPSNPNLPQDTPLMTTSQKTYPVIAYILPSVICKLLNNTAILINIWWSRTHQILLMGMGVATVFSYTFGYLIIVSLNTGLAYQISRKKNKPEKIGIFYQRALLVNFIICAITITPLLYISKKVVVLFDHIDDHTSVVIGEYLFQLLPSIYCFAFFDTTQTFLMNQGHVLGPLIIQIVSVFMHMFLINHMGAAWSKNFTDVFCCVAVYGYILLLDKPLKSWTEWTIKCIKGWGTHMKFLEIIGLATYVETLFFFLFSLSAFKSPISELICHMCFINIMQIIFVILLGIKVGSLAKLGFHIKSDDFQSTKKQAELTMKIILCISFLTILIILVYQGEIVTFFIHQGQAHEIFNSNYWILIVTIALTSIQSGVSSLVKALQRNFAVLKLNIACYCIAIILANVLCYKYEWGFQGVWFGWNIGTILNTLCCVNIILKKYRQIFIKNKKQMREKIYEQKAAKKQQTTSIKQKLKIGDSLSSKGNINNTSIQMKQMNLNASSKSLKKEKTLSSIQQSDENPSTARFGNDEDGNQPKGSGQDSNGTASGFFNNRN